MIHLYRINDLKRTKIHDLPLAAKDYHDPEYREGGHQDMETGDIFKKFHDASQR